MPLQFSFDAATPIYQQIIAEFRRALARGELGLGEKVPSQRDLAQLSRVNPNTVQRAYREMEAMGIVETLRGQGTFICSDPELLQRIRVEMADESVRRFLQEMKGLGLDHQRILAVTADALRQAEAEESDGRDEAHERSGGQAHTTGSG